MDKKNARDVTPEDFDPIDGLPYAPLGDKDAAGGSTAVGGASRSESPSMLTGKATPTEVFPETQTASLAAEPAPAPAPVEAEP